MRERFGSKSGRRVSPSKTFVLATAALLAAGAISVADSPVGASATGHTLVVNGASYESYQHSGAAIHWNTPTNTVGSASFNDPETGRNQVWTGNGAEHLPCPGGIHWISNDSVLTISHCLDDPNPTTTTTTTTASPTC